MRAKAKICVGALVLALLGGATALAAHQATRPDVRVLSAPARDPQAPGANTTARGALPARPTIGGLSSLRRERRAQDLVPRTLATSPLLSDGVGDLNRARRARSAGGRSAWIMPGRKNSICVVSSGALNCAPVEVIQAQGVAPSIFKTADGPFTAMGIASDEVRSVEVTFDAGKQQTVAVVDNAFVVAADSQPRQLRWAYRGKERSFQFPSGLAGLPGNP